MEVILHKCGVVRVSLGGKQIFRKVTTLIPRRFPDTEKERRIVATVARESC